MRRYQYVLNRFKLYLPLFRLKIISTQRCDFERKDKYRVVLLVWNPFRSLRYKLSTSSKVIKINTFFFRKNKTAEGPLPHLSLPLSS